MNLNVQEMLTGDPVRLRYTERYSTCRVNHRETVAEHSFFVGFYALMIGLWCTRQGSHILWSVLMSKAMIHDIEEARTGDWPRNFKHSDQHLRDQLDRVAEFAFQQSVCKLWDVDLTPKSDPMSLVALWKSAKIEGSEGAIVAFADFLSVLSYIAEEFKSGNTYATEHVQNLDTYFEEFNDEAYNFIRPLIDQAGEFLREIFAQCRGQNVAAGTR